MTPRQRLLGQSALQAFRSDIIPGATEATQEDQAAILVATLLRQSLATDNDADTSRIQNQAIAIARTSLGDEALNDGCTYDDFPAESTSGVIRLLAQRTDHAGRLRLAEHLLESAAEIESDPLESGRILWDRGRIARKLGYLELAFEQNQQLLRDGRRLRSAELTAKAHHGLLAVAQTRGNYVEFRAALQTALRIARRHRLKKLYAASHSGLGTSHAMAGQFGEAVANFWKAYELSGGKGYIARTALGNLGQTLLISGRPVEARKVATIVLQQSPLGTSVPSIGAFAVASAQLGDAEGVRWAATQISRFAEGRGHAREVAETLMECSASLEAIGENIRAAAMKRRSELMALQYGFHSLTFTEALQSVQRIREPSRFNSDAAKAAAAITEIEVPRLPELAAALPG